MNREIKFRAWDEDGYMFSPTGLGLLSDGGVSVWDSEKNFGVNGSAVQLMQYTGLKDKNAGTEIYECDIIDSDGKIIGNEFETPELRQDKANLIVQGFGTGTWLDTYQEAVARGCYDA